MSKFNACEREAHIFKIISTGCRCSNYLVGHKIDTFLHWLKNHMDEIEGERERAKDEKESEWIIINNMCYTFFSFLFV